MKLTVIIPVYNVEKFILPCLESLNKSLSYLVEKESVEILVINDGATDHSGALAKRFCEQHERFYYYKKPNGGLGDARNYGLAMMQNEFVCFVDSDDEVREDYLVTLLSLLDETIDLILFDVEEMTADGSTNVLKGMDLEQELWTVIPSAWNKVYNRKLFQDIQYPKGKWYEDVGTTYKLIHLVEHYIYVDKPLYKYRKNRTGSILSTSHHKINDLYEVLEDVYRYYEQHAALTEHNKEGLTYQYVKLLLWSNMYRQLDYYKPDFVSFINKMVMTRQLIYAKFPNWQENRLLLCNQAFFTHRLGNAYMKTFDYLGKSSVKTMFSLVKILYLNQRMMKRKG